MKKSFGMRRPCSGPWFHIATRWPWASFNFYKPRFQHPSDVNDTNSYLTGNSSGFKRVKAPLRKDSILPKIRIPVSGKCAVLCLVAQSHPTLCKLWSVATRLLCPWDFPGKNTGVGCHFLLQGIFPTQGSNPGLLHCRRILQSPGKPRILGEVAYPFSRGTSQPKNRTRVSCIPRGFLISWAIREARQANNRC